MPPTPTPPHPSRTASKAAPAEVRAVNPTGRPATSPETTPPVTPATAHIIQARAGQPPRAATPSRWLRVTETAESGPSRLDTRWLNPSTGRPIAPDRADRRQPINVHEAFTLLERLWHETRRDHGQSAPVATGAGGWIGLLRYPLGAHLEPTAHSASIRQPLIDFLRCDDWTPTPISNERAPYRVGPLTSNPGREGFTAGVRRVLEYLRAGDTFQINLAHQLSAAFEGDPEAAFADLAASARPLFGLCMHTPATPSHPAEAILSCSPELFLSYNAATGRVETRPMKGTRPIHADPEELRHAAKDQAELAMIVDLMRNDLGRVCAPGTLSVTTPRTVERHAEHGPGGVLQATATVAGTLAPNHGLADLLAATFPPGSVTGAPKVRAMQIIDELEPFDRGLYCGATLWLGDDGLAELAVAIRTATISEGRLVYPVGAGIVIDSDPDAEWRETLDKARILQALGAQLPE